MPSKFRDATHNERLISIGIGLLMAFIFASTLSFIAPFMFQWGAGYFDPDPNIPSPCDIRNYLKESLKDLQDLTRCRETSDHFEDRMWRLRQAIPWFWIFFLPLAWRLTRQAWKGRIRDDSEDVSYPGQLAWDIVLMLLMHIFFFIAVWAFFLRSPASLIALGFAIAAFIGWGLLQKWLLGRYGTTQAERQAR